MISGDLLTPRIGGLTVWGFAGDQQFAQHMKIASQHTNRYSVQIPFQSGRGNVSVRCPTARRQLPIRCRIDCRALRNSTLAVFSVGPLVGSPASAHKDVRGSWPTRLGPAGCESHGRTTHGGYCPVTLLGRARLLHDHVAVALVAGQYMMVRDEACSILKDQHQPSKLYRLGRLAALIQLRVRLEDAEQLLVVGNRLALEHPPPRQVADVSRSLEISFKSLSNARVSAPPFLPYFRTVSRSVSARVKTWSASSSSSR